MCWKHFFINSTLRASLTLDLVQVHNNLSEKCQMNWAVLGKAFLSTAPWECHLLWMWCKWFQFWECLSEKCQMRTELWKSVLPCHLESLFDFLDVVKWSQAWEYLIVKCQRSWAILGTAFYLRHLESVSADVCFWCLKLQWEMSKKLQ
jgi:hypothetical protein